MKSDDVVGRVKTYEAIIKGENIPEPGIPESFKGIIKKSFSPWVWMSMFWKDDGTGGRDGREHRLWRYRSAFHQSKATDITGNQEDGLADQGYQYQNSKMVSWLA